MYTIYRVNVSAAFNAEFVTLQRVGVFLGFICIAAVGMYVYASMYVCVRVYVYVYVCVCMRMCV